METIEKIATENLWAFYRDQCPVCLPPRSSLAAMWETWVQSLGWDDPLEKGLATRPRTEEPDGLQSVVSQRDGHS